MSVLPIVLYPDPVLLKPTRKVERFDEELRDLVRNMTETMFTAGGVGLAANQVGIPLRLFIVDLSVGEDPHGARAFVNPVITELEGRQVGDEGCLSFPDVNLEIERAERATIEAFDLDGRPFTLTESGLISRAIQHECEHLDGQVFLRHLSALKRELVKNQIKKRIKAGDWLAAVAG